MFVEMLMGSLSLYLFFLILFFTLTFGKLRKFLLKVLPEVFIEDEVLSLRKTLTPHLIFMIGITFVSYIYYKL